MQDALHKEQGKGLETEDIIADLASSKGVRGEKLQQGRDSGGRNAKGGDSQPK